MSDQFINGSERAVEIKLPASQTSPVVYSSPHSGRIYPDAFKKASVLGAVALRRSEDAFVDELYSSAPDAGSPLLLARFPRAYVDPNREMWELDPTMFDQALPDYINVASPRIRAGLGTIARVVTNGANIYKGAIDFAEAQQRIEKCYKPFHETLAGLLEGTVKKFGAYLLIDCHSMPSIGGPMDKDPGLDRVDMVLGDANGTSCAGAVSKLARETLESFGYRVVMNKPYAGGFTTRNYGKPYAGRHALQIEVNRALYMDEDTVSHGPGFDELKNNLDQLISTLSAIDPDLLKEK